MYLLMQFTSFPEVQNKKIIVKLACLYWMSRVDLTFVDEVRVNSYGCVSRLYYSFLRIVLVYSAALNQSCLKSLKIMRH